MKMLCATLFLLMLLLATPLKTYAACTVTTVYIDGRLMNCTTCCDDDGDNCFTTCF